MSECQAQDSDKGDPGVRKVRRICKAALAALLIIGGGFVVFGLGASGWWMAPGIILAFDL